MAEADLLGLGAYASSNQTLVGQVPASAARSRFKSRNSGLDLNKVGLMNGAPCIQTSVCLGHGSPSFSDAHYCTKPGLFMSESNCVSSHP